MNDLLRIPGVGEKTAEDLRLLGVAKVDDLIGKDPEDLFKELCIIEGRKMDRCLLYVFRCAVYFANEQTHDPVKLKWWNWKEKKI